MKKINNLPKNKKINNYIVARKVENELWYYGAYGDSNRAFYIAQEINGIVITKVK